MEQAVFFSTSSVIVMPFQMQSMFLASSSRNLLSQSASSKNSTLTPSFSPISRANSASKPVQAPESSR